MDAIDRILDILHAEGHRPQVEMERHKDASWEIITWEVDDDDYSIYGGDIAVEGDNIAWFQTSDEDDHLLRVFQNQNHLAWTPITHNPAYGCECLLVEWYQDHLLFIYQEKHDVYVCAVRHGKVNTFQIEGDLLARNGDRLAFETFRPSSAKPIRVLALPSLKELEPLSRAEAEWEDLTPGDLHQPDGFLSHRDTPPE